MMGLETAMTVLDMDMPPHLPMTAEEFEELPSVKGWRIELWEGNLDVASAAQMAWHSITMRTIANILAAEGRAVVSDVGVVLAPRTVRAPDVMRFRLGVRPDPLRSQFPVADVDLVVEIISPESIKRDRLVKPEEYATAGIAEFWLVEQDPADLDDAVINIHHLTPQRIYVLTRTARLSALEQEIES
jgi:Uma2 family endonuclease